MRKNGTHYNLLKVLESSASQEEVYKQAIGDAVRRNIFRGFNTTIISYGQKNSGKSYTMYNEKQGNNSKDSDNSALSSPCSKSSDSLPFSKSAGKLSSSIDNDQDSFICEEDGIAFRAINDLFMAKKRHATGGEVSINATFFEIYNDRVIDLLGYKKSSNASISTASSKFTSIRLKSPSHARAVVHNAFKRKSRNRSHTVCTLQVTINPAVNRSVTSGRLSYITSTDVVSAKLTLVDLAGSERISNTPQKARNEFSAINKDLFVLGKCITALAEKSEETGKSVHIPFRDSKLTSILRGSLGGNCCTVMLACVSPDKQDLEESLNTLRYAERTRNITNRVKKNMVKASTLTPAEGAALRRENKVLKAQLLEITKKYQFLRRGRKKHDDSTSIYGDLDSVADIQGGILFSPTNSHVEGMRSTQPHELESQKWRMKFEKLSKICTDAGISTSEAELSDQDEALLVSHQVEVQELREQLQQLINCQFDDMASVTSGLTMDTHDYGDDHSTVSGVSMLSSLASKSLESDVTKSNYIEKTRLMEDEDNKLEARIRENKTKLVEMDRESILRISALKLKLEKEESSHEAKINELKDAQTRLELEISNLHHKIETLTTEKSTIEKKVNEKENELQVKERLYVNEMRDHETNLNQIHEIVNGLKTQVENLENRKVELERESASLGEELKLQKESFEEKVRFETEQKNLKCEIKSLTEEKLALCEEVEDLQNASHLVFQYSEEQMERMKCEEKIAEMIKEIESLKEERSELQNKISSMNEAEIERTKTLVEDVHTLKEKMSALEVQNKKTTVLNPPILQERTNQELGPVQKPPLPSAMHMKRCSSLSPSARSFDGSIKSTISVSNLLENFNNADNDDNDDNASVLFGDNNDSFDQNQSVHSCFSDNSSMNSEQLAVRMHAQKLLFWANKAISRRDINPNYSNNSNVSMSSDYSFASSINNNDKENNPRGRTTSRSQNNINNIHNSDYKGKNSIPRSSSRKPSRSPSPFIIRHKKGCSCTGSIFSGKADHTEFFLPKLGMACNCGAEEETRLKNKKKNIGPTSVKAFLREWQVSYLKSIGITTAKGLIRAEKRNADDLAKAMKLWRHKMRMKPARTKSCLVALQIWSKVAKSVVRSAIKQQQQEKQQQAQIVSTVEEGEFPFFVSSDCTKSSTAKNNDSPMFWELDFNTNFDEKSFASVSTMGNNMSMDMDDSLSLMEGEFEI